MEGTTARVDLDGLLVGAGVRVADSFGLAEFADFEEILLEERDAVETPVGVDDALQEMVFADADGLHFEEEVDAGGKVEDHFAVGEEGVLAGEPMTEPVGRDLRLPGEEARRRRAEDLSSLREDLLDVFFQSRMRLRHKFVGGMYPQLSVSGGIGAGAGLSGKLLRGCVRFIFWMGTGSGFRVKFQPDIFDRIRAAVDPHFTHHRVYCVAPLAGPGKAAVPVRPDYVPLPPDPSTPVAAASKQTTGISTFYHEVSDDGQWALAGIVALDRASLLPILTDAKKNIDLNTFGVAVR